MRLIESRCCRCCGIRDPTCGIPGSDVRGPNKVHVCCIRACAACARACDGRGGRAFWSGSPTARGEVRAEDGDGAVERGAVERGAGERGAGARGAVERGAGERGAGEHDADERAAGDADQEVAGCLPNEGARVGGLRAPRERGSARGVDAPYARRGRTPGAHTRQSLHTSALLLRRARAGAVSATPARRAVARVPATAPRHARAAPPASTQRGSGRGFGWSDAPGSW